VTGISGLPPIADTALPAGVRNGTTKDKDNYKAALGFEQMLVQQVVQTMAGDGSDSSSDGDDGTSVANPLAQGPYASTMQTTLANALTANGGLGLAQQIYKEMGSK
jgi:Rod binding domain-containing protein